MELSDAIAAVREQLVSAQLDGRRSVAGRALSFKVGKVVLELAGEVRTTAGGSGEVKFWVATAAAKADRAVGSTHKMTIELIPQGAHGESFDVSDDLDAPPPR